MRVCVVDNVMGVWKTQRISTSIVLLGTW